LSEQTRYFRFFGPYPHLSQRDVERFTVVDHDRPDARAVSGIPESAVERRTGPSLSIHTRELFAPSDSPIQRFQ